MISNCKTEGLEDKSKLSVHSFLWSFFDGNHSVGCLLVDNLERVPKSTHAVKLLAERYFTPPANLKIQQEACVQRIRSRRSENKFLIDEDGRV